MPLIIPAGFALAAFKHQQGGSTHLAVTTLGLDAPSFDQAFAEDLSDAWATTMMDNMPSSTTFLGVSLKVGPNATGPTFETVTSVAGGDSVGSSAQVAGIVKKSTALGGRSQRGRMYLPGVPEEYVDAKGAIASAWTLAMGANIITFLAALVAIDAEPVLFHSASSDPTPITTLSVLPIVGTQRRRVVR